MKNKNIQCKLFRTNEGTDKLLPRSVMYTDDIVKEYKLDETTHRFMMEELRESGRYWLNDDEVIGIFND